MTDNDSSQRRRVLVTDYAWNNLELEHKLLAKANASVVVAQTGSEEELADLAVDVDGILTCWKSVTQKVLRNAFKCQAISRYGIGLDNIDVEFATRMGIVVTNVPSYCIEEVSDHAIAMLLALARRVVAYDRAIKAGSYDLRAEMPLYRIKGKTLGIVGFGRIGRALCRKARGLGLHIIAYDRRANAKSFEGSEIEIVNFKDLLRRSDYVSIHVPLTAETRGLFGFGAFRQMKPSAFLINTARGDIVDAQALLQALNDKLIAGAALDVLSIEPPEPADALVLHSRTIVTPHAAFNSEESLVELRETAAIQMARILSGEHPGHIVNPKVLAQANLRAKFVTTGGLVAEQPSVQSPDVG